MIPGEERDHLKDPGQADEQEELQVHGHSVLQLVPLLRIKVAPVPVQHEAGPDEEHHVEDQHGGDRDVHVLHRQVVRPEPTPGDPDTRIDRLVLGKVAKDHDDLDGGGDRPGVDVVPAVPPMLLDRPPRHHDALPHVRHDRVDPGEIGQNGEVDAEN